MTYLKLIKFLFNNHKEIIDFDENFSDDIQNLKNSKNIEQDFEILKLKIKLFNPDISIYSVLEDSNERDYYIINFKTKEHGAFLEAQLSVCKDNKRTLHYIFNSKFLENDFSYDFLQENFLVFIENEDFSNERVQSISNILGLNYKINHLILYTDITSVSIEHNKENRPFLLSFAKEFNRIMINNTSFLPDNYLIDNNHFTDNLKEFKDLFELNLEF